MADQKLSDLTALTAPSGDDLLYVVDDPAGTPSDKKLALDNLFTRGTVTVSSPVIDAAQTWNAGGVTFTGLKFNAATGSNTGSATASLLMDLQLEGASKFSVSKNGFLQTASDILFSSGSGRISRQAGYGGIVFDASNQITLGVDSTITLIGGTNGRFCIGATDLLLTRHL